MNCVHRDTDGYCLKYSTYNVDVPCDGNPDCIGFAEWDEDGKDFCVLTNADRIRAMSDEELAEFKVGGHCPPSKRFPDCATIEPCSKCWLEYLRQPAKDGDNDG